MSLAPLLAAPPVVIFHAAAAGLSLLSGAAVAAMRKGTRAHVALGRVFVPAMLAVAVSSFWITGLWPGRFSPIHILSVVTIVTLPIAVYQRRKGNIRAHAAGMGLNLAGLLAAGAFTLAPGRILGQVFGIAW